MGGFGMAGTEASQMSPEEREIAERVLKMRLKVLDRETGNSRYCTLAEAKTWDWANPEVWRIVNGWQITSFKRLLNMLYLKAQKGHDEIEILEAPRFTMLSGG
jgi:hypothetical protein